MLILILFWLLFFYCLNYYSQLFEAKLIIKIVRVRSMDFLEIQRIFVENDRIRVAICHKSKQIK